MISPMSRNMPAGSVLMSLKSSQNVNKKAKEKKTL